MDIDTTVIGSYPNFYGKCYFNMVNPTPSHPIPSACVKGSERHVIGHHASEPELERDVRPQCMGAPNHLLIMKWVWVNTYRYIFSGMNIHLPAILGFTRGTRFWHTAKYHEYVDLYTVYCILAVENPFRCQCTRKTAEKLHCSNLFHVFHPMQPYIVASYVQHSRSLSPRRLAGP